MLKLNARGDTIIEVMIAIIILTGVLGATFAISNKSQKTTQANHERYQAQLILNSQAEMIRSASANKGRDTFIGNFSNANKIFCMLNNDQVQLFDPLTSECAVMGIYKVVITAVENCNFVQAPCTSTNKYNTFYIKVTWESLVSNGQDQVELVYGI